MNNLPKHHGVKPPEAWGPMQLHRLKAGPVPTHGVVWGDRVGRMGHEKSMIVSGNQPYHAAFLDFHLKPMKYRFTLHLA